MFSFLFVEHLERSVHCLVTVHSWLLIYSLFVLAYSCFDASKSNGHCLLVTIHLTFVFDFSLSLVLIFLYEYNFDTHILTFKYMTSWNILTLHFH